MATPTIIAYSALGATICVVNSIAGIAAYYHHRKRQSANRKAAVAAWNADHGPYPQHAKGPTPLREFYDDDAAVPDARGLVMQPPRAQKRRRFSLSKLGRGKRG
ncbi:uncharacterized protein K452DRAFT_319503 [Aplosporella prunicola CBS 121167]|uniref:Uncharacterized protein n=1 Tax=Aplosporella prunicola CBS 121167 TaxID=1176127 RepID=A0A6A6B8M9_9PEZI|nr:uncharacterized protein K452DRAFT_319503 [Aplosporella prunicola CBS 121167]KAF2140592.1 hypothetical protein K452DRAFT_319503 [Aplosporella prunicola CBS 121167]